MFDISLTDLTSWLEVHQQWIIYAIAITAFLESLALVGIVIPGIALLFAVAAAAGAVNIPLLPLLGAAFCGAVLGDTLSFFIGRHFHHSIKRLPPFTSHPQWITKGEQFFQRYGLFSVAIGRFVGPIRPILPLIAGMLEMQPSRFIGINLISAMGWAPLYLLPGYLMGSAADNSTLTQQHFLFVICTLLGGWLMAQLAWWFKSSVFSRKRKIILTTLCIELLVLPQVLRRRFRLHLLQL